MRNISILKILTPLLGLAMAVQAEPSQRTLVVTATNANQNQLLVYDSSGNLIQTVSTKGQGGVSGNAGGIATRDNLVAVVNFGSKSVSIFKLEFDGFHMTQSISARSNPVSVAFGADHLYILGTTTIESHQMYSSEVGWLDGLATLLHADGTAAQVGVLPNQIIVTEKSNMIETVNLTNGAVGGVPTAVSNLPGNVDTPFGLVTRGDDAYVTIAHADETSLVRNGTVLTTTASGTQHAPCWATLLGPFLYTGNTGSQTVSRYAVYGQKIVQDAAIVASQNGATTDIASGPGMIAVIDGSGQTSHLSIYTVDEDGNFTLVHSATINAAANGVAVVPASSERFDH
ncbi:MAG TPA: hypothetical protein VHZ07_13335 [Bryobacteraceae bacterium]|jgi:hypothetical protein|nr:hypothetical protein [Bryobacteraceae bacterium]